MTAQLLCDGGGVEDRSRVASVKHLHILSLTAQPRVGCSPHRTARARRYPNRMRRPEAFGRSRKVELSAGNAQIGWMGREGELRSSQPRVSPATSRQPITSTSVQTNHIRHRGLE